MSEPWEIDWSKPIEVLQNGEWVAAEHAPSHHWPGESGLYCIFNLKSGEPVYAPIGSGPIVLNSNGEHHYNTDRELEPGQRVRNRIDTGFPTHPDFGKPLDVTLVPGEEFETMRDKFAMATVGYLVCCDLSPEGLAKMAYDVADAMMLARQKQGDV